MNIAIKILKEEIERQTILLKAESDIDFVVDIAKKIDELENAVKKLTVVDQSKQLCEHNYEPCDNKAVFDFDKCSKCGKIN